MRRLVAAVLVVTFAITVCACGDGASTARLPKGLNAYVQEWFNERVPHQRIREVDVYGPSTYSTIFSAAYPGQTVSSTQRFYYLVVLRGRIPFKAPAFNGPVPPCVISRCRPQTPVTLAEARVWSPREGDFGVVWPWLPSGVAKLPLILRRHRLPVVATPST
jgi:hypothetical protein